MGRDPERTPMPWNGSPLAGFTLGKPWLPLGDAHTNVNVESVEQDKNSILHLYRILIAFRRTHSSLVSGDIRFVTAEGNLLRYERSTSNEHLLVLLNLGSSSVQAATEAGNIIAATQPSRCGERVASSVTLDGSEALLIQFDTKDRSDHAVKT
jgi:alpha-glucosidase